MKLNSRFYNIDNPINIKIPILYPSKFIVELIVLNYNDINYLINNDVVNIEDRTDVLILKDLFLYGNTFSIAESLFLLDANYSKNSFEVIDKPFILVGIYDTVQNYGYIVTNDLNIPSTYYKQDGVIKFYGYFEPLNLLNLRYDNGNLIPLFNIAFSKIFTNLSLGVFFEQFMRYIIDKIYDTKKYIYNPVIHIFKSISIDLLNRLYYEFIIQSLYESYGISSTAFDINLMLLNISDIIHDIVLRQIKMLMLKFEETMDVKFLQELYLLYINNKNIINFRLLFPQYAYLFDIFDMLFNKVGTNIVLQTTELSMLLLYDDKVILQIQGLYNYVTNDSNLRVRLSEKDISTFSNPIVVGSIQTYDVFGDIVQSSSDSELLQLISLYDIKKQLDETQLSYNDAQDEYFSNNDIQIDKNLSIVGKMSLLTYNDKVTIDLYCDTRCQLKRRVSKNTVFFIPTDRGVELTEDDLVNIQSGNWNQLKNKLKPFDIYGMLDNIDVLKLLETLENKYQFNSTFEIKHDKINVVLVDLKYYVKPSKYSYIKGYKPVSSIQESSSMLSLYQSGNNILNLLINYFQIHNVIKQYPHIFINSMTHSIPLLFKHEGNTLKIYSTSNTNDVILDVVNINGYVYVNNNLLTDTQSIQLFKQKIPQPVRVSIIYQISNSTYPIKLQYFNTNEIYLEIGYLCIVKDLISNKNSLLQIIDMIRQPFIDFEFNKQSYSFRSMGGIKVTPVGFEKLLDNIMNQQEIILGIPTKCDENRISETVNQIGIELNKYKDINIEEILRNLRMEIYDAFVLQKSLNDILSSLPTNTQSSIISLSEYIINNVISNYPSEFTINKDFVDNVLLPSVIKYLNEFKDELSQQYGVNLQNNNNLLKLLEQLQFEMINLKRQIEQQDQLDVSIDDKIDSNPQLLNTIINFIYGCVS